MSRDAFLRELRSHPEFGLLCQELVERRNRTLRWNKRQKPTKSEWIYESGVGDGIDFVLNTLGYDHDGSG